MSDADNTKARGRAVRSESLYGDTLGVGAMAGDFVVESTISSGGWGTVYLARHRTIGRTAAVKVLHRDLAHHPVQYKRFVAEAKAANQIGHENIVDIYDIGRLPDGRPYLIMEWLAGRSLADELAERGALSREDVLVIGRQLAAALAAAHAAKIVHRDLKAKNVQVKRHAASWHVTLLDFGIAKFLDPESDEAGLTTTTTRLGSVDSMAPEQILGLPSDERTDVYAFGVLLFHMLTGKQPYSADTSTLLEQMHLSAEPPSAGELRKIPAAVDDVVRRCLAKEKQDRFGSVQQAFDAFERGFGSVSPRSTACVGIYVEARIADELSDSDFETLTDGLRLVESRFETEAFVVAMQSGNAVLAVRAADPKADVATIVRNLARELPSTASLNWLVVAHRGGAILSANRERPVLGGELTQLSGWRLDGTLAAGAYATAAFEERQDQAWFRALS